MIWWSFRCTPKFITIIFLYVTFNDLLPFVSPQSMFSWTPIIKQGEIFITSSTKFDAAKRNFFSRDEPGASNIPSAISEGSMLSQMREDAYLYNENTKEKEINLEPKGLDIKINDLSSVHRTNADVKRKTIQIVPYNIQDEKIIQHTSKNNNLKNLRIVKKNNALNTQRNSFRRSRFISRGDSIGHLTWTSSNKQSKTNANLSNSPLLAKQYKKRIKKKAQSKTGSVNEIKNLSKKVTDNEQNTINSFSAEILPGVKDNINLNNVSNTPRFLGVVMVNSDNAIIAQEDSQIEDKEMRELDNAR